METTSLKSYFKDVRKLKLVKGDEQTVLAIKAQEGDEKALNELVEANLRFVISIAKEYRYRGVPLEDLVNEGNIGLIKAVNKFDATKNIKFISYAVWWIRQSIIQSIYDNGNLVRLPVNRININNKINKIKDVLEKKLDREPTNKEISDAINIEEKDVRISFSGCNHGVSFDNEIGGETDSTFGDLLIDGEECAVEQKFNRQAVTSEIESVLGSLSDRESIILKMYYGLEEYHEMTLREIGEELNLTNERVRQIKECALKRLRMYGKCSKLKEFLT